MKSDELRAIQAPLKEKLAVFSFDFVVREPEQLKIELHLLSVKLDNLAKHSNTV